MDQAITPEETVLLCAFENAISSHGVKAPMSFGLPADIMIVKWTKVIEAYDHLTFFSVNIPSESQASRKKRLDARRKELQRLGELLVQRGIVAKDGDVVWLTGKPWRSDKPEAQVVSITLPQLNRIENLLCEIIGRLDRLERPHTRPVKTAPRASQEYKKQAARFYALAKEAEKAEAADDFLEF